MICFVVTSCNSINYVCEVTPHISIQLLTQSITPILGTGTCSHPKKEGHRLNTEFELICFVVTSCNSINYVCEVTPHISI
ncbi:MAG: hypothetical protein PF689_11160, partial [Deltaproteobacteria bacterium]|nr:hypothetical protein [Deltaproteobacteria bacterium]